MGRKSTNEELKQRIKELEKKNVEQKRVEALLLQSEKRYRSFLENLGDAAYETDPSGNITYANKVAEIITSLPLKDIIGKPFLPLFTAESQEIALDVYQRTLNGESPEYELTLINGRTCSFKNKPMMDENGDIIGVFGIARDVTERRQAEKDLKRAFNELEKQVHERTIELLKINKQLKQEIESRKKSEKSLRESEKKFRSLTHIGLALSVEKDINMLLEMIVYEARSLTNADAGTLYLLDDDKKNLHFMVMQNDTLNSIGKTIDTDTHFPGVPLFKEGNPNYSNVSSYAVLTGKTLNLQDVYEIEEFTGTKEYDFVSGYRSKSMLVIPMKNHENEIFGILQLINAQDPETGDIVSFPKKHVDLIASLASQAAVALINMQLIQDMKHLFYALIKSIATAIDEKSPSTGGHIKRVVELTMLIADKINQTNEGHFKAVHFSEDEKEELRLSAWMHDIGKITTPEYIVEKKAKLQTITDRFNLIETRFHAIEKSIESWILQRKIELLQNGNSNTPEIISLNKKLADEVSRLRKELEFIKVCNYSDEYMSNEKIRNIIEIANKAYSIADEQYPYLTEDEVKNLCIRKGTLTDEERKVIEKHVFMTYKMLEQLPFPKKQSKVPEYASGHHEKMDGSGYHQGLSENELSLQTRILAFADIFEALTAKDRPYRKPMKLSQAVKIMDLMKRDKHIDPYIYDLFINTAPYYDYVRKFMNPEQIDVQD
ncbi:MAG: PAS domain S-box protein [Deltaproteobacteria bacterium]|nr:PAS domain S-box protein [Deltaproteobacteria bacterium]